MRQMTQLKLSAYLTLLVWFAALAGLSWAMLAATSDSRAEFSRMLFGTAPSGGSRTATAELTAAAPARTAEVPAELKNQLTAGLERLTETLQGYSVQLANGAAPPTGTTSAPTN